MSFCKNAAAVWCRPWTAVCCGYLIGCIQRPACGSHRHTPALQCLKQPPEFVVRIQFRQGPVVDIKTGNFDQQRMEVKATLVECAVRSGQLDVNVEEG
jgi:hypothetical protein